MAYSYPNITGKEIKRNVYTYQAVAEDELSGSFDTLEDCALTSLTVIVKDEKGEQIATVDLDAAFCFYENAAGVERYSYDYNETDRGWPLTTGTMRKPRQRICRPSKLQPAAASLSGRALTPPLMMFAKHLNRQ